MKKLCTLLFFFTLVMYGQYTTPGNGVVWTLDSLVANSGGVVTGNNGNYTINALVTISANDFIKVPKGSTVMFTATTAGFEVNGALWAVGTDSSRITFSSPNADSTGAYMGFKFNDSSIDSLCKLVNCNISYAYYGVRAIAASPTFSYNFVYKCRRGADLSNSSPLIARNIIARSYEYGITMTLASSPVIEGNDIYDNNTQNVSAKNQISVGTQGDNSPIIRNNKIHGSTNIKTGGISVSALIPGSSSSAAIITNNEIYNNSYGIALAGGTITATITDNLIYNNNINTDFMTTGSGVNVAGNASNTPRIARNFIAGNHWGITVQNGSNIVAGPQPNIGTAGTATPLEEGHNIFRANTHSGKPFDLYNNCTNNIYAQLNDWGVYDSASIEQHVFHKADTSLAGTVYFVPFSSSLIVSVLTPNGGETLQPGSIYPITWETLVLQKVKIEYTSNNGTSWNTIIDSIAARPSTYNWQVPAISSAQCKIRISNPSNSLVFDTSDSTFTIGGQPCKDISFNAGWNLSSVPLTASSMAVNSVFPLTNANVYAYNNGYVTTTTTVNGAGYWVRYPAIGSNTICGNVPSSKIIPVNAGWNIIGPFNQTVPITSITTVPANIISSGFYGFANGYTQVSTLEPGKGYWVRVSQAGTLNLASSKALNRTGTYSAQSAEGITITDKRGYASTLNLYNGGTPSENTVMLPPLPPADIFDARFSNGTSAASIAGNTIPVIEITGAAYPVTIASLHGKYLIKDAATHGKILNLPVSSGTPVTILNQAVQAIEIHPSEVTFDSLMQNYPNPFNPATTIVFTLHETRDVSLKIYNMLGQLVHELVNAKLEAGTHSYSFNATGLASGTYFYELRAGSFRQIQKMIFLK
ncbi:MAG: T9SS type A sorting domain-containing protein [Ignavibacteria bacterium]|nr:T9SS type A sorting domain-containing protein [Ignavibacteria bacterium]